MKDGGVVTAVGEEELQLRFDGGHQQRYFSDRRAMLACVIRVSTQSPDPRFEVWGHGEPVLLADGREAGKRFELKEVLDLSDEGVRARVAAELAALESEGEGS
jgi:hypothetical protein